MHLDGLTLMFAGSLVSGVGAFLMFAAWLTQLRSETVIAWWAAAYVANAAGLTVLALGFGLESPPLAAIGSSLIPLAAAGLWTGMRAFHRLPPAWPTLTAVALACLAGSLASSPGPVVTTMVAAALLYAAVCYELWQGREERRLVRWPLAAITAVHAVIFAVGAVEAAFGNLGTDRALEASTWFGLIYFEEIVFLLAGGVLTMMMCRERQEAKYVAAARINSLTGVANRGAFFHHAERLVKRSHADASPVSLIEFDLDHFKAINDSFGHAVGDQVLRAFADAASSVLRPGDLFGRTGGEEFAAILPGAGEDTALVIADRVRHALEALPRILGGAAVRATVSAGVATAEPDQNVASLLEAADRALYRAKRAGRNRVERASDVRPLVGLSVVRFG